MSLASLLATPQRTCTTLFVVPSGAPPVRVVEFGDTAPGTGGATLKPLSTGGLNNQGEVLFSAVYVAAGLTPPIYTDPTISAGATATTTTHIAELRAAEMAIL